MITLFEISTGRIVGKFEAPAGAQVTVGGSLTAQVFGNGDFETDYVADIGNGPEILSRPLLPELVESPVGTFTATGCPTGMTVEVWDTLLNELLATIPEATGVVEITLPDPGSYRFVAKASFPFRDREQIVVVS